MSGQEKKASIIDIWREIIVGEEKYLVMFEHGTVVGCMVPQEDLGAQEKEIMEKWGPVFFSRVVIRFSTVLIQFRSSFNSVFTSSSIFFRLLFY